MDLELTDKVAVVTGAGKGIGLAVTEALAAEGALVVAGLADHRRASTASSGSPPWRSTSRRPTARRALVQRALDEHGRVDVLVNNVGAVRMRLEGFLGTSDEEFEWAMQMNFFIALRATRAARRPRWSSRAAGAIVNVASVNAFFQPDAGTIDYGAAKAALVNLTKSLAQEFGPKGIRVNCRVARARSGTDLWLGEHGVAETVARGHRRRCRHRPRADRRRHRRLRHRPLHHARGGRHAGHAAGLRAHRQRHRGELRDRRRTHQDDLEAAVRQAAQCTPIRSTTNTSVSSDQSAAGAALAVAEHRRDRDAPAAPDLHPGHALVPALDHLALAQAELEGVAAVPRGVELLARGPDTPT